MSRFVATQAKRGALPLFVGLCGASGSGKTFSALRLAAGIQRVCGGELVVIDTESNRALHYADRFAFKHLPFSPPFSPDDYWEAIQAAVAAGARTIVIDSMSHEHEGPGGVLELHEKEAERIQKAWGCSADTAQFPAWKEPKGQRRRLINNILQLHCNLVVCFRAKRKVKMQKNERGKQVPTDQGWMPIAGDEYAYEMTALGVLPPGSSGVPDWKTTDPGSELVTKRPAQFHDILKPGAQLTEDMGEAMARWAAGTLELSERAKKMEAAISAAPDLTTLEALGAELALMKDLNEHDTKSLRRAYSARKKALAT
jgi:hypothetical protein